MAPRIGPLVLNQAGSNLKSKNQKPEVIVTYFWPQPFRVVYLALGISGMKPILAPKFPREKHWDALKSLPQDRFMSLEEFLSFWAVDLKQVALITGCTLEQVKNWSCKRTKVPAEAMRRLLIVHELWIKVSQ